MAHSLIGSLWRKIFAEALKENNEAGKMFHQSRRNFLQQASLTAGGLALAPLLRNHELSGMSYLSNKRIVIIGGGIAGLNACYQLKKKGIDSTLYEATSRTGGRMFTMNDAFGKGISTDIGGEFVDHSHSDIIHLVRELGLSFHDLRKDHLESKELYFKGRHISNGELIEAFAPFLIRLVKDIKSLPGEITYRTASSFRHLDSLSITEYLSRLGIKGWLFDFINVVLTREYGMEASEQSAINFLTMFQPPKNSGTYYEIFGNDHEIFKIKGGSQRLCDALYEKVKEQVILNHQLTAIQKNHQSGYDVSIKGNGEEKNIQTDFLILTLPFSVLRSLPFKVDMHPQKRKVIDELGYGNSCKFIMGMNSKPWREAGRQGYTFSDISFGCGWDSSQGQSNDTGSFTVFGGGNFAEQIYQRNTDMLITDFVNGLNSIYPGAKNAYNTKNMKFCWNNNPTSKAGYTSFKKGQWSTLAGWESVPVGNIYFAGEHTSMDFQGYMNGAAQTGRLTAEKIANNLIKHTVQIIK